MACDFVVSRLRNKSVSYLRLNTEDLASFAVDLDPVRKQLVLERDGQKYRVISERLRSVFFRRPVFLRDYGDDQRSPEEQFSRHQWSAFIRNLMVFDKARWINDPVATYRAEHKAVQLSLAAELGFPVPETRITNAPHHHLFGRERRRIAMKGIDTVMVRANGQESFGFTTFGFSDELERDDWKAAPATIQTALDGKLDIRVTVVEEEVFAASISIDGRPTDDDWRLHKRGVRFRAFDLPETEKERCRVLVRSLGLRFGGIDLALCNGKFYFIEINPTGEWAWLVDSAGLPIDRAIANALSREVVANGE